MVGRTFSVIKPLLRKYFPPGAIHRLVKTRRAASLLLNEYGKSIARGFTSEPPTVVRIDVAATCNLRCRHCPTGTRYGDTGITRGLMSDGVFDAIISQISKIDTLKGAIFYLAGEPLMHPKLSVFLTRMKRETYVRNTAFVTNGMLLDREISRKLAEAEVDHISVSIDGRSREENDFIRRGAKYERILENVMILHEALKGKKTSLMIENTIIPFLDELYKPPNVPRFLSNDFAGLGVRIQTFHAMRWPGMTDEVIERSGFLLEKNRVARDYCSHPFHNVSIRYNGDIVLCCYDLTGEMIMGNIMKNDLQEVWNGERYRAVRKAMASFELLGELPAVCRRCPAYSGEGIVLRRSNDLSEAAIA